MSGSPALDVSVVIPSHASAATVPGLIDALARQDLDSERFEAIVVDTGADGTWRVLEEQSARHPQLRLRRLRGPIAGGPAVKRNLGAAKASGRVLAFTDSDCLPEPAWLDAGLAAVDRGARFVQGPVLPPLGTAISPRSHYVTVHTAHGLYETANMFYERDLFQSLGGFTTRYYARYGTPFGEDAELGWRARRSGAEFQFEPSAIVRHPVSPGPVSAELRRRWLARGFPHLVRDAPELRDVLFYRRWFLSRDSARFAGAALGAAAFGRFPVAGLLALPYARSIAEQLPPRSAGVGARSRVISARLLCDAVLLAALAGGSLGARRLLL